MVRIGSLSRLILFTVGCAQASQQFSHVPSPDERVHCLMLSLEKLAVQQDAAKKEPKQEELRFAQEEKVRSERASQLRATEEDHRDFYALQATLCTIERIYERLRVRESDFCYCIGGRGPKPNPFNTQVEQGLLLDLSHGSPHQLFTRWGADDSLPFALSLKQKQKELLNEELRERMVLELFTPARKTSSGTTFGPLYQIRKVVFNKKNGDIELIQLPHVKLRQQPLDSLETNKLWTECTDRYLKEHRELAYKPGEQETMLV